MNEIVYKSISYCKQSKYNKAYKILIRNKNSISWREKLIFSSIASYKNDNKKFKLFSSLGERTYFSAIKYSTLVAGNSSSLFYEVPYFKKYSLNFGIRQTKRLHIRHTKPTRKTS